MAKIFLENTLGECRINILIKKGERELHSYYLSFILSAGEGEGGSVILSESDLAP